MGSVVPRKAVCKKKKKKITLAEKVRGENPGILMWQRQLCIFAASWSEHKLEESGKGRKR